MSVAGLVCLKPDARDRLFYRVRIHCGRTGERRRNRLKRIHYRPALISGFLAQTGLTLEPEPP